MAATATGPRQQVTTAQEKSVLDATIEATLKKLDESAQRYATQIADSVDSRIWRMVVTSRGLRDIRSQLTDAIMHEYVMPLMNSDLGFRCDRPNNKNPKPYEVHEVRECVVQALLLDFQLTGNEFNIIAGRFYGAQNGYRRKLQQVPSVTDLVEAPGVPVFEGGKTKVRMAIRLKINGKPWQLMNADGSPGRVFSIRVNEGMGDDAVIGKAKRKALKAAFEEITGTQITELADNDEVDDTVTPPTGRMDLRRGSTGNGHKEPEQAPAPGPDDGMSDAEKAAIIAAEKAEQEPVATGRRAASF